MPHILKTGSEPQIAGRFQSHVRKLSSRVERDSYRSRMVLTGLAAPFFHARLSAPLAGRHAVRLTA